MDKEEKGNVRARNRIPQIPQLAGCFILLCIPAFFYVVYSAISRAGISWEGLAGVIISVLLMLSSSVGMMLKKKWGCISAFLFYVTATWLCLNSAWAYIHLRMRHEDEFIVSSLFLDILPVLVATLFVLYCFKKHWKAYPWK